MRELKQSSQYTESKCESENGSEMQQLKQQLHDQRMRADAKAEEVERSKVELEKFKRMVSERDRPINENEQFLEKQHAREQALQRTVQNTQDMQHTSRQDLSEHYQTLQHSNNSDLTHVSVSQPPSLSAFSTDTHISSIGTYTPPSAATEYLTSPSHVPEVTGQPLLQNAREQSQSFRPPSLTWQKSAIHPQPTRSTQPSEYYASGFTRQPPLQYPTHQADPSCPSSPSSRQSALHPQPTRLTQPSEHYASGFTRQSPLQYPTEQAHPLYPSSPSSRQSALHPQPTRLTQSLEHYTSGFTRQPPLQYPTEQAHPLYPSSPSSRQSALHPQPTRSTQPSEHYASGFTRQPPLQYPTQQADPSCPSSPSSRQSALHPQPTRSTQPSEHYASGFTRQPPLQYPTQQADPSCPSSPSSHQSALHPQPTRLTPPSEHYASGFTQQSPLQYPMEQADPSCPSSPSSHQSALHPQPTRLTPPSEHYASGFTQQSPLQYPTEQAHPLYPSSPSSHQSALHPQPTRLTQSSEHYPSGFTRQPPLQYPTEQAHPLYPSSRQSALHHHQKRMTQLSQHDVEYQHILPLVNSRQSGRAHQQRLTQQHRLPNLKQNEQLCLEPPLALLTRATYPVSPSHHPAVRDTSQALMKQRLSTQTRYTHQCGSHHNLSTTSSSSYAKAAGRVFPSAQQEERTAISSCEKTPFPKHITVTSTLPDITNDGMFYVDDDNDFSLEIPEGAIGRANKSLTISVGVALQGPFQFPEGLRPVSPTFWVCVHSEGNFQFSKPVTVTVPHFLNLKNDDDIQSLGLTFLKAQHNMNSQGMYVFQQTDGKIDFKTLGKHGILKTNHFCSYCIACRDIPMCLQRATFCITAVLPNGFIPVSIQTYGYFFITFQNQTCLRRLRQLVQKMNFDEMELQDTFEFQIGMDGEAALEISITQPRCGRIGVAGGSTVCLSNQGSSFIHCFIFRFCEKKLTSSSMGSVHQESYLLKKRPCFTPQDFVSFLPVITVMLK